MAITQAPPRPTIPPDDVAPEDRDRIPPLVNGDHLTADEFRRRYHAMGDGVRAELIGGVVYMEKRMASPVNNRKHGKPHATLCGSFTYYLAKTSGLEYGTDATVRLDDLREPQPDLFLALPPHMGGGAHEDEEGYIVGVPELVCEVSATSERRDLHQKLDDYRHVGVKEYLVWRTVGRRIDWFELRDGEYTAKQPDAGLLKSSVFPGLWLDADAVMRHDLAAVFKAIEAGCSTPEHADFAARVRG
jgi:Uma2 family endonuclease